MSVLKFLIMTIVEVSNDTIVINKFVVLGNNMLYICQPTFCRTLVPFYDASLFFVNISSFQSQYCMVLVP